MQDCIFLELGPNVELRLMKLPMADKMGKRGFQKNVKKKKTRSYSTLNRG